MRHAWALFGRTFSYTHLFLFCQSRLVLYRDTQRASWGFTLFCFYIPPDQYQGTPSSRGFCSWLTSRVFNTMSHIKIVFWWHQYNDVIIYHGNDGTYSIKLHIHMLPLRPTLVHGNPSRHAGTALSVLQYMWLVLCLRGETICHCYGYFIPLCCLHLASALKQLCHMVHSTRLQPL